MAVRRVDDQHVDTGLHERAGAIEVIAAGPESGCHPQATVNVLVGVGILATLVDVLHGDEPLEHAVLIDHRQLLDAMLPENALRFVERGADGGDHQILGRHHVTQRAVEIALELQVAVGEDTHQESGGIDDRHTRDLEAHHERHGFAE